MGTYDQMGSDVDAAIRATAARAGMSPAEWKAIASIESSLSPQSNRNAGTQYKGLFQIGSRGAQSEWATHGSGDIYNAMDNANAAAALAARNNTAFQSHFGRAPTAIETYMMHQQGLGFYTRGAMTNITGNLPPEARTPENMTHNGFQNYWAAKLANRANKFRDPDDPNEIAYGVGDVGRTGGTRESRGSAPDTATAQAGTPPDMSKYTNMASSDDGTGATTPADGTTAPASTDASSGDTAGTGDYASKLGAAAQQVAKLGAANQPPPLPPLQPLQPMVTPAMQRARQMVQAMLNLQAGGGGDPTGGSATT